MDKVSVHLVLERENIEAFEGAVENVEDFDAEAETM
jgi:hypothetical protein